MISAPWSPRICVAKGPGKTRLRSTTLPPAKAPVFCVIVCSVLCGLHSKFGAAREGTGMAELSAKTQLDGFIAEFEPAIGVQAKKVLAAMRKRLPGALELVYDNYNALAIGFAPTERASDVIFSIAVYPK